MEIVFKLEEINTAAEKFVSHIKTCTVIAFHGEMGAGKTTFIHAVCELLGVKSSISSPTFSIINEYVDGNDNTIYHMDLYRIKDEQEAINAGVEDCLYSGKVCFVEWPDKAPGILPDNTLHVSITMLDTITRKVEF